jgi:ring-1,2-phenylacetyl-CoA epoxidase subunit PaaC
MLADDALVLSQRLQQWCTNLHELEDEVALANIALDLLGQARLLLARAGTAEDTGRGEDELAFLRSAEEYRNVLLVERPNGDFAQTIVRLLVFTTWRLAVFSQLQNSIDPVLAAIAAKAVKELTYHRDYAAGWAVRLGDGTEFSHQRMLDGLAEVWPDVGQLFVTHPVEQRLVTVGVGVDPASTKDEFDAVLLQVLQAGTLELPPVGTAGVVTAIGRDGQHSAELSGMLAEMQSVARANPGATW